jgi:WD40 repeat protein
VRRLRLPVPAERSASLEHADEVRAVAIASNGRLLTGGVGPVTVWDGTTGAPQAFPAESRGADRLALSPDGQILVTFHPSSDPLASDGPGALPTGSGNLLTWNVETAKLAKRPERTATLRCLAWSPGGSLLAMVDALGQVRLRDRTGRPHQDWCRDSRTRPTTLAVSPDDRTLVVGGEDGSLAFWNVPARILSARLKWQSSPVSSLAFRPDGKFVAVGTRDGMVYQLVPPARLGPDTLRTPVNPHGAMAYTPDGKTLAVANRDRTVSLLDTRTGQTLVTLPGHLNETYALAFSHDGRTLATLGVHETDVLLWDVATGKPAMHSPLSNPGSACLAFSPAGPLLAVGSNQGVINLWDAGTQKPPRTLHSRNPQVYALAFSPDGLWLAAVGSGKRVELWDLSGNKPGEAGVSPPTISHGLDSVAYGLGFRRSDKLTLVTGEADGKVCFWQVDGKSLRLDRKPVKVGGSLTGLEVSRDGRALLIQKATSGMELRDPDTLAVRYFISRWDLDRERPRVTLSPSGPELAVLTRDAHVQFWDTRTWQARTPTHQTLWPVRSLAFSPDGGSLLTGSELPVPVVRTYLRPWLHERGVPDRWLAEVSRWFRGETVADSHLVQDCTSVRVWDPAAGREQAGLTVVTTMAPPDQVAVAPAGRPLIAAGGRDGSLRVWNRLTGQLLTRLFVSRQADDFAGRIEGFRMSGLGAPIYPESVRALAFSPDGALLVAASSRGAIKVWDTGEWKEVCNVADEPGLAPWAAFSPAGELVICIRGSVQFLDPRSGKHRRNPIGRTGDSPALRAAFSLDGRLLAVARHDRRIRLYDLSGDREPEELLGHGDEITALAFAPDGRTLASASHDRTVRLWSVRAAAEVASLTAHQGKVHCLAFSPDGTTLASGGETNQGRGEVFLWRAPRE